MRLESLYISESPGKGRGVFTTEALPAEIIVEIAPVLVMNAMHRQLLDQTPLHDYIFEWGEKKDQCALALGWISIYNHAYNSNCEYFMDYETDSMFIKTTRTLAAGEELCVNYHGDSDDSRPLWFKI